MTTSRVLSAARGATPGDIVFRDARILNVFTGALEAADICVADGVIAGIGSHYDGASVVSLDGGVVVPGLIDAHVHIESALVTPPAFARAVVPRGTMTAVTDPHEIANVHGTEGIRYMLDASKGLPLDVRVMASSCVPATSMATTGAALDADSLVELAAHPRVLGLAEVMNFPGVIGGDPAVLEKLARFAGRPIDGHAPGVGGRELNAYVAAGPASDHEATSVDEALEKVGRGMWVFLREATNARNLLDLVGVITPHTRRRLCLCTDDRQPTDLLEQGGIDHMIRLLIAAGVPATDAVVMATLNPAEYFGLRDRGAIAPGRIADFIVIEALERFEVSRVFKRGVEVAVDGVGTWAEPPDPPRAPDPRMSVPWARVSLAIPHRGLPARIIDLVPDQLVTNRGEEVPPNLDGLAVADPERDLLKIAVIDRYSGTARTALGFVRGFGLDRGALAGSVAHDHHNIIVVGVDDTSMMTAARCVGEAGGALVVACGDEVLCTLDLPVAGLMSPSRVQDVAERLRELVAGARSLGCDLHDPFMALSFLGLEVIPSLKITDHGLVDVDRFDVVPLWVEAGDP